MQIRLTILVDSAALRNDWGDQAAEAQRLCAMLNNIQGVESLELRDERTPDRLGLLFVREVGQIIVEIAEPGPAILAAVAGIVALWIKGRSSKIVKLDQTKLELRGDFGPEEAEQWAQQFSSIVIDQGNRLSREKGRTK
jgi:hypothetical protein